MFLLGMCEALRMFVNTLTADNMSCFRNSGNLEQEIQMQLSKKQKSLSQFFAQFVKSP